MTDYISLYNENVIEEDKAQYFINDINAEKTVIVDGLKYLKDIYESFSDRDIEKQLARDIDRCEIRVNGYYIFRTNKVIQYIKQLCHQKDVSEEDQMNVMTLLTQATMAKPFELLHSIYSTKYFHTGENRFNDPMSIDLEINGAKDIIISIKKKLRLFIIHSDYDVTIRNVEIGVTIDYNNAAYIPIVFKFL